MAAVMMNQMKNPIDLVVGDHVNLTHKVEVVENKTQYGYEKRRCDWTAGLHQYRAANPDAIWQVKNINRIGDISAIVTIVHGRSEFNVLSDCLLLRKAPFIVDQYVYVTRRIEECRGQKVVWSDLASSSMHRIYEEMILGQVQSINYNGDVVVDFWIGGVRKRYNYLTQCLTHAHTQNSAKGRMRVVAGTPRIGHYARLVKRPDKLEGSDFMAVQLQYLNDGNFYRITEVFNRKGKQFVTLQQGRSTWQYEVDYLEIYAYDDFQEDPVLPIVEGDRVKITLDIESKEEYAKAYMAEMKQYVGDGNAYEVLNSKVIEGKLEVTLNIKGKTCLWPAACLELCGKVEYIDVHDSEDVHPGMQASNVHVVSDGFCNIEDVVYQPNGGIMHLTVQVGGSGRSYAASSRYKYRAKKLTDLQAAIAPKKGDKMKVVGATSYPSWLPWLEVYNCNNETYEVVCCYLHSMDDEIMVVLRVSPFHDRAFPLSSLKSAFQPKCPEVSEPKERETKRPMQIVVNEEDMIVGMYAHVVTAPDETRPVDDNTKQQVKHLKDRKLCRIASTMTDSENRKHLTLESMDGIFDVLAVECMVYKTDEVIEGVTPPQKKYRYRIKAAGMYDRISGGEAIKRIKACATASMEYHLIKKAGFQTESSFYEAIVKDETEDALFFECGTPPTQAQKKRFQTVEVLLSLMLERVVKLEYCVKRLPGTPEEGTKIRFLDTENTFSHRLYDKSLLNFEFGKFGGASLNSDPAEMYPHVISNDFFSDGGKKVILPPGLVRKIEALKTRNEDLKNKTPLPYDIHLPGSGMLCTLSEMKMGGKTYSFDKGEEVEVKSNEWELKL